MLWVKRTALPVMMIKNYYFGSIWHNKLIFLSHGWPPLQGAHPISESTAFNHLLHDMIFVGTLPVSACPASPDYNLWFPIARLWGTSLTVYSDCSSNPVGCVV
jgi:hypothetical protein